MNTNCILGSIFEILSRKFMRTNVPFSIFCLHPADSPSFFVLTN